MANNAWEGSRIGQNAAENNNFATDMIAEIDEKAWLEGKISDADYKESQRIKLRNDQIEGNIALGILTLGDAVVLYQGARALAAGSTTGRVFWSGGNAAKLWQQNLLKLME